ncbi:unnamed protein product [Miscanthus lutarioriparius]|uniref:Uncharacterized protein n=1 Tax=Miscanthus lutarioriparius TaxID=422564 RepID=A0A811MRD6_9POAL|nr:unnamed protein product [Miscanthus lutarioriparius]
MAGSYAAVSFPPPPSTSTSPLQSAASEVSEGSTMSAAPLTLESLAAAIIDINRNIASMQAAWAGLVQQPSPPPFSTPPLSTGPAGSYAAVPISTPLGTHPWATLALSSAAPPVFTTATATVAPLPAQQPAPSTGAFDEWMATLVHNIGAQPASVPSSAGAQSAGLVLGVPVPPFTGAQPGDQIATAAATVQVALAQKSDCQSATVRLQAAARGLLARRRLQEMRRQMHEAALTAMDLGKGGHDLAPSNGQQQPRRPVAVSRREHGAVPAGGALQFYGSDDRRSALLFVTGGDALPSAAAFRCRPPRGRLRWSLLRLIPDSRTRATLSFRWSPWDPGGYTSLSSTRRVSAASSGVKNKESSLFEISRDVKGLFLGVQFVSSEAIVSIIVRSQLEDELHVQAQMDAAMAQPTPEGEQPVTPIEDVAIK